MSQFIDKLNQASQAVPQPMGFRAGQPGAVKPRMLLVANLLQVEVDNLAGYVAGADAGILPISTSNSGIKTLEEVSQTVSDIPWGEWLGDVKGGTVSDIAKAKYDFVVFPEASALLAVPQNKEMGRILQVEASVGEGLLRAVNELPVDAVLITVEQEKEHVLTWRHLMLFRRFADLLSKPLLAFTPSNVTTNELRALWEAGLDGMVVKVGGEQPKGRLSDLRQTIDKLTFPSPRKRGKAEALLPYISRKTSTETEEEEEE
jgi:hypothetical protein